MFEVSTTSYNTNIRCHSDATTELQSAAANWSRGSVAHEANSRYYT